MLQRHGRWVGKRRRPAPGSMRHSAAPGGDARLRPPVHDLGDVGNDIPVFFGGAK